MEYRESLFTFLDILGFRSVVEKRPASEVGTLLQRLRKEAKPDAELAKTLDMSFLTFSDCTVRAVPIVSEGNSHHPTGILFYELLNLAHCQYRLLMDGYSLRGGMTVGDICFEEGMVFGPALAKAYALESEFANYPRIVIDPKVFTTMEVNPLLRNAIHDAQTEKEYIGRLVHRDSDGLYFLDYLRGMNGEFDEPDDWLDFLAFHKKWILQQARGLGEVHKIAAKYLWVATYHNEVVGGVGGEQFAKYDLDIHDYLISNEELPLVYEMD